MFHEICTQITRSSRKKEIWFCRNCKYRLMDYYKIHSLVEHRKEMTVRCYFYFQILAFMYSLFTFYHQGKFISIKIFLKKVLAKCIAGYKSYRYVISMSDMVYLLLCLWFRIWCQQWAERVFYAPPEDTSKG